MIELLPHQIEDAELMVEGDNALNYSGMGTGKTLTTLNAFGLGGYERALVLAPPIALTMWQEEITNFTGMSSQVLRTGKAPILGEPDFVITTYALATGGQMEQIDDYFYSDRGQVMILDEAHALKSRDAKRTKGVFGPSCTGKKGLFELFDFTWSLTGTPVLRYYDDLWAQLRATKPDVLRSYGVETYDKFVLTFCASQVKKYHPRQRPQRVVVANKRHDLLAALLRDCGIIKRTLREVAASMPPVTYRDIQINNSKTTQLAKALKMKEEDIAAGLAEQDGNIMEAWQEMSHARLKEAAEYIRDCAANGPVLVGHWFRDYGGALTNTLRAEYDLTVAEVNGSTHANQRDEIRNLFNSGGIDVLVGQVSAMNTSWNIQEAAAHVIMAEDHFSPGLVDQFIGRVYRMGQKNHVQVDFIKSEHPIDEALTRVRTRKSADVVKAGL